MFQDLLPKFSESVGQAEVSKDGTEIDDLSNDSDHTHVLKKNSTCVTDPSHSNGIVLKKIKIEKD